ncbi:hypothetical protein RJT34_02189 [Clitoria ternatea]|uniref:Uncharacterized protein n=1 Tax=Clitoria ternatea TaxID=43366 RepID=A0AAN9KJQ8_CLITE
MGCSLSRRVVYYQLYDAGGMNSRDMQSKEQYLPIFSLETKAIGTVPISCKNRYYNTLCNNNEAFPLYNLSQLSVKMNMLSLILHEETNLRGEKWRARQSFFLQAVPQCIWVRRCRREHVIEESTALKLLAVGMEGGRGRGRETKG